MARKEIIFYYRAQLKIVNPQSDGCKKKKIMVTFRKAQSKSMTFQIGFLFLLVFLSLLWVATLLLGL